MNRTFRGYMHFCKLSGKCPDIEWLTAQHRVKCGGTKASLQRYDEMRREIGEMLSRRAKEEKSRAKRAFQEFH
ncbi:hypothetical protein OESDEN_12311 [Oesophagostomum dentatum]|uniref:Uncharacterized protein n=1 Tax=Oesophagostomum dentatum TaxID=61180 RepID=A0A0B1SXG4_OESDE|nr:hypothetical protein OESDEN_12311 [Oesophagostomum dentatum]